MRESRLWSLHMLSAAALLALLSLHMGLMHYAAVMKFLGLAVDPVLGYAAVAARDRSVLVKVIYALLLGFALYHGLYGARGVLREIWPSPRAGRAIDVGAVLFGLLVFGYGLAVLVLAGRPAGMM
jgi:succinate dehydrogenase hydrophobic anchor subunit